MINIINIRDILNTYNEYKETLDYNLEEEQIEENLDYYEVFGVVAKYWIRNLKSLSIYLLINVCGGIKKLIYTKAISVFIYLRRTLSSIITIICTLYFSNDYLLWKIFCLCYLIYFYYYSTYTEYGYYNR